MNSSGPTLTGPTGMGGINAQAGFDYQIWDALARLPAWLKNDSFEGFGVEMLEDVEARFFAPHAPSAHLLERFQAKAAQLQKNEIKAVFESFADFERAYPKIARVQTLVTPSLPPSLGWIGRDTQRVRQARPFYAPFAGVRAASDAKLKARLADEFGTGLGNFVADGVEVSRRYLPDRRTAEAAFDAALHEAFPDREFGRKKVEAAFAAVVDLSSQSRGQMLARAELLNILRDALGWDLVPPGLLRLHVRSDRNHPEEDALEIDASPFSGPSGYPQPTEWEKLLLAPLERTARWTISQNRRRVALSGSYRLSTAFALGWNFRAATGFEIEIPAKSGTWATDDYGSTPRPEWEISQPDALSRDRLIISLGVLRRPEADVARSLSVDPSRILVATLATPVTTAAEAQASVRVIKAAADETIGRIRPNQIDLFMAVPAALAAGLGHRWNGMPRTQLHEFDASSGKYSPTALLE